MGWQEVEDDCVGCQFQQPGCFIEQPGEARDRLVEVGILIESKPGEVEGRRPTLGVPNQGVELVGLGICSDSMDEKETTPSAKNQGHPRVVATLLIVATLLAFAGIFSIWVNRQALNTENWTNTSEKLLQDKAIQTQVSTFLVTELYANVDVEAQLQQALPPKLQPLAGPAAGGIRQLAQQVAEKALTTPAVQQLWADANRAAHKELLAILNGGGPALSTNGGTVTLNLAPLVQQLGSQLGVGGNLASKLPADAGSMTILRSDQLSAAQEIAKLVRYLAIVLTLLSFLLFAAAVYLAGPRRREALRSVGIGFIAAGVLALIVRDLAGDQVVNALATSESVRPAAVDAWTIGSSLLVTVATSTIVFGILLIIGALLAGPTRYAKLLRREASPHVRENRGLTYVAAGAVFLALIAWAPVSAFHKPLGILIFAVLLALGTEVLRRQVLHEFPDSGNAGDAGDAEPDVPAQQA